MRHDSRAEIEWPCQICCDPIADGEGYITRPFGNRHAGESWEILHRDCDLDIERTDYSIAVGRIRTPDQVDEWFEHLDRKVWFCSDLWAEVESSGRWAS